MMMFEHITYDSLSRSLHEIIMQERIQVIDAQIKLLQDERREIESRKL